MSTPTPTPTKAPSQVEVEQASALVNEALNEHSKVLAKAQLAQSELRQHLAAPHNQQVVPSFIERRSELEASVIRTADAL
jgi:hypothetical protein